MTPQPLTLEQLTQAHNLAVLAPELSLTLFALAVLLAGAFFQDAAQRRLLPLLALCGVAVAAAGTAALWNKNQVFGPPESAVYVADNFALFFKWIFLIGLGVAILISGRFLDPRSGDSHTVIGEYYGLMMLSTVGMMFVSGGRDLLVMFLGIETLSIALYVLVGFARRRLMSNEAALKYFLLGAFASGFLLYGIALVYYAVGSTAFPQIAQVVSGGPTRSPQISPTILYLGLALLIIGLSFKAALVPFHQWTPDVYEGAPTPVTAFMAVGAKAAAFAALLRVLPGAFGAVSALWHPILLAIAVLTMSVGNIVAIAQDSLKRMLAYSSVAHAGYLLMGVLAAASANRQIPPQPDAAQNATAGVMFYLVAYALMNMGAFAILVYLENARTDNVVASEVARTGTDSTVGGEDANIRVDELNGLAWREPLAAAAMTVFLLSLAGIPPTAGFFGKLYIFREAMGQGLLGLVLVGVLNTVISVYYYLRPVVAMYSQQPGAADAPLVSSEGTLGTVAGTASVGTAGALRAAPFSISVTLAIMLCAVAVIAMVMLQAVVFPWAHEASAIQTSASQVGRL